jgi:hypothetical protein
MALGYSLLVAMAVLLYVALTDRGGSLDNLDAASIKAAVNGDT